MNTNATYTEELIARAGLGDSEAAERLWPIHRDPFRRMVATRIDPRVRARVDPSDVVQEALAEAARALPQYLRDRPLPFLAWLRQFAFQRLAELHLQSPTDQDPRCAGPTASTDSTRRRAS